VAGLLDRSGAVLRRGGAMQAALGITVAAVGKGDGAQESRCAFKGGAGGLGVRVVEGAGEIPGETFGGHCALEKEREAGGR